MVDLAPVSVNGMQPTLLNTLVCTSVFHHEREVEARSASQVCRATKEKAIEG